MSELFDNLSRSLASPMARRQTLRLVGGMLVVGTLSLLHKRTVAATCPGVSTHFLCPGNFDCCPLKTRCCLNQFGALEICTRRCFCPSTNRKLENFGQAVGAFGSVFSGIGLFPVLQPFAVAGTVLGVFSGISYGLSKINCAGSTNRLSEGPPDPNFKEIWQPVAPSLPRVLPNKAKGITIQLADTYNALLKNLEESTGLGSAIYISLNRAGGAENVGDEVLENEQFQASRKYTLQLSELIETQPQLFAKFANAYKATKLPKPQITIDNVVAFQNKVRINGLPPDFIKILKIVGADNIMQNNVLENILNINPLTVTALKGSFPNQFVNPSFAPIFRETTQAINAEKGEE